MAATYHSNIMRQVSDIRISRYGVTVHSFIRIRLFVQQLTKRKFAVELK